MILGQLYYEFIKGLYEINFERAESRIYSIFISLIIFPFSLHMQEQQSNFWIRTVDSLNLYDQWWTRIKKLNTELHYSGNEINSEFKDQ